MKFMLIMQTTQRACESMSALSPAELEAHFGYMNELVQDLQRSGEFVLADGLEFPVHARIVCAKDPNEPIVSDGPFPESKEFLAGFWIVDVPSRQRALQIAARISSAPGLGGAPMAMPVEVRQLMTAPPAHE
jgi:hypothetical protein